MNGIPLDIPKELKNLLKEIRKNNHPVKHKTIIVTKRDMPKRKPRKPQETGFICDDFEILL